MSDRTGRGRIEEECVQFRGTEKAAGDQIHGRFLAANVRRAGFPPVSDRFGKSRNPARCLRDEAFEAPVRRSGDARGAVALPERLRVPHGVRDSGERGEPAFERNGPDPDGLVRDGGCALRAAENGSEGESEEYKTYHALKETVMGEETTAALIREYRKLQLSLQMSAVSGAAAEPEDMQRFSGISTLLFSKPEVSNFLMAEMRLQQMLADIFKIITEAADVDISIPGLER